MDKAHLDSVISTLEALEKENLDFAYDISLDALRSLGTVPAITKLVTPDVPFFRARTYNDPAKIFDQISEISAPPKEGISEFGRCNTPSQRVFYASDDRSTSYMEQVNTWLHHANNGDSISVTVGRWKILDSIDLAILPNPDGDTLVSSPEAECNRYYRSQVESLDIETVEYLNTFFGFMYNQLISNESDNPVLYAITSAYFNSIVNVGDSNIGGMIYSSVPFGGEGMNIALSETMLHSGLLQLEMVMRSTIVASDNNTSIYDFSDSDLQMCLRVNPEKGTIEW